MYLVHSDKQSPFEIEYIEKLLLSKLNQITKITIEEFILVIKVIPIPIVLDAKIKFQTDPSLRDGIGLKLNKEIVEDTMKYFINLKSELTSSMHQDLINGNQLEIESINGAISKIGKLYDVPTPINDIIYDCLSLINKHRK